MALTHRTFKESGYIFIRKHDDTKPYPAVADWSNMTAEEATAIDAYVKAIAVTENWIGLIKGGYTFASTVNAMSDQDDMGILKVDDITDETATNTFSLFNANAETIKNVYPMAKYAENAEKKLKLASLGGKANKTDDTFDILFVHPDTREGDLCIYTIGKNIEGLTIQFQPGSVTPLPCSYAAQTIDGTGTLAKITEHDPAVRIFTPPADTGAEAASVKAVSTSNKFA